MRCPGQCGELHIVSLKSHASAFLIRHFSPAHAGFVSTFLGNKIFCHIIRHFIPIDPQFRAFAAVHISFFRSHAVPGDIIIVRVKFKHHAELRHISQFLHRVIGKSSLDGAISEYPVSQFALSCRSGGHKICKCNPGAVFFHSKFRKQNIRELSVCHRFFMSQIHTGKFPLSIAHGHQIALIIVIGSSPEIRLRNHLDHFHTCITVGNQSAIQVGEHHFKILAAHAQVMSAVNHLKGSAAAALCAFHLIYCLSESHLMTFGCPDGVFLQQEGNRHCILTGKGTGLQGQRIRFLGKRIHMGGQGSLLHRLSVSRQRHHTVESICIHKQVLVDHSHLILLHLSGDVLIIELHFLHLRGGLSVSAVGNTVAAEVVIAGTVIEISAIGKIFLSVAIFFINRLIDVIPDKSALIQRLRIGQIRVFVHGAAGISHGMGVLAADKRFASVFRQELFDGFHRRIHLAFHIAGIVVTAVMHDPFIMNQTGGIFLPVELGHLIDIPAAEGFIAAGPDQDGRMVLISLVHGIYPVQHHVQPFRMIAGHHSGEIRIVWPQAVPGSVGLQIVFRDHIKTIFVKQIIDAHRIRIMAGTDGVDIVLLHGNDILHQFLPGYAPACPGTELMAVHAFKHDTFSVEGHNMILHFKTSEAYPLRNHLCQLSLFIIHFQGQIVQIGFLRAPQKRLFHLHHIDAFLCHIRFQRFHCFPLSGKSHTHFSSLCGLCHNFQIRMGKCIVQQRPYSQI